MTIHVTVNGERRGIPAETTVGELVAMVTELATGVAAAVNGEIVPRRSWPGTPLRDGDQVEVVTAVQGG
jgi:sulfur carrier protein